MSQLQLQAAPSFLQRRADGRREAERRILAQWIAANLFVPGSRVFVTSGTTVAQTAEEILQWVDSVHIDTNSVPVAWAFMQLVEQRKAAAHAAVAVSGGILRPATGIVDGKVKIDKNTALLFSPHGITRRAITGDRDVDLLRVLLNGRQRVIMPVSWSKLNREGAAIVKHIGHWKQADCQLVITTHPHPDLSLPDIDRRKGKELLDFLQTTMGSRLVVRWVPLPAP